MKKNKLKKQTSETFRLSAILAISGGFQDAYTYNVREEVFSNANRKCSAYEPEFYVRRMATRVTLSFSYNSIYSRSLCCRKNTEKVKICEKNTLAADNRTYGVSHIIYCRFNSRTI